MTRNTSAAKLVTTAWKRAYEDGHVDGLDAVLSPRYLRRGRNSNTVLGRNRFKASIVAQRAALDDLKWTVLAAVEDGDRMAFRWQLSGIHQGRFLGVAPSGRRVTLVGASFIRMDDGMVVEEWVSYDRRDILRSLGVPLGLSITSATTVKAGRPLELAPVDAAVLSQVAELLRASTVTVSTSPHGPPHAVPSASLAVLSEDQPLVLLCLPAASLASDALRASTHFGISVLSSDQAHVADALLENPDTGYSAFNWTPGTFGSPLLKGACAQLELAATERVATSTHDLVIGRVITACIAELMPLTRGSGPRAWPSERSSRTAPQVFPSFVSQPLQGAER